MPWQLTETVVTQAGAVRAGRTGSGPPLVLAHGWPWSSYAWHRVIPALEERWSVHVYDMPGYGRSQMRNDQSTALDVQGWVFAQMLVHWELNRPTVWAHDVGGAVTLRAHLLHGAEFERYVLMNVVAMRPWGSDFFTHVGRHVDAFTGLPPHIHEAIVRAYIKGALISEIEPADMEALVAPWLSDAGRRSFYKQFAEADERYTAQVEPMFCAIRCPVAVVWGADDPWIPLSRGKALADVIGTATFDTLPGVGHMPQLEAPERTLRTVAPRLTS